jgi:hypothetical protein
MLDACEDVARRYGHGDHLAASVRLTVLHQTLEAEPELIRAASRSEIIVARRERTPFPASVFAALPRLQLVVTTGMRDDAVDLPPRPTGDGIAHQKRGRASRRAPVGAHSGMGPPRRSGTLGRLALGLVGTRITRVGLASAWRWRRGAKT